MSAEHSPAANGPHVSRRSFLRGVGSGAAAGLAAGALPALAAAPASQSAPTAPSPSPGIPVMELERGRAIVTVTVNGTPLRADVAHRVTLLEMLRDQFGLTGTKLGCDRAECGACTVVINGRAVYACSQLAVWADGKEITTVEGLARGGQLHPLQQAFMAEDAGQCNYCIPGQMMAAKALLDRNANPSEDDVQRALAGNLCRCGNFNHIQAAVLRAARLTRGEVLA